ncbi:MAG: Ger(x)C family spore germination C-terminal domain-containing protein [Oscillospiraceae bacterium]
MKRSVIWFTVLSLALVLFGNTKNMEISDRALVHAVGIDQSDDGYTITMQVFKSDGAGSDTQIDPSKANTKIISATAKSFNEAIELCENQLGNSLFLGHNQVIVLGKNTDFSNTEDLMKYFIRHKDSFLGVNVVMAEDTAKDILSITVPTATITTENFKDVIDIYEQKGEIPQTDMVTFINETTKPDKSVLMPIVTTESEQAQNQSENKSAGSGGEEGSGEQTLNYKIEKNAVISNGKIVGEFSVNDTTFINLVTNKSKEFLIPIQYKEEDMGIMLNKCHSKIRLEKENGNLVYKVNITVKAALNDNLYSLQQREEMAKIVADKIYSESIRIFNQAIDEYDADLFDLYKLSKHYQPKMYLEYENNFDALKHSVVIYPTVCCKIQ